MRSSEWSSEGNTYGVGGRSGVMYCQELVDRLDGELRTADYAEIDVSENGLQVGPAEMDLEHVAFAVDTAVETIERAVEAGADLLVTHHGLSWGGIDRVTGREYDRLAALMKNDLALYTAHLPLDGHQSLGNAAGVGDVLGLESREPFGTMGPEHVGQRGNLTEPQGIEHITETLQSTLDTGGEDVQTLAFGSSEIRDVAVVTGSGVNWLDEAVEAGADVLVTGEGKQKAYHDASEAGIHVVLGGHYATETFGVQSLADLVSEWGLETTVIDCPTGL